MGNWGKIVGACLVWLGCGTSTMAAPPQLTGVVPRGWKPGATQEVLVQGANLTAATKLLCAIPGLEVSLKSESKPAANQMVFVVKLPEKTPLGVVECRVANEEGLSSSLVVMVDQVPTVQEIEPNNALAQAQAVTLPVAIEGRLTGVEADLFAFEGKAGQRLVAEVAGRRMGCNLKPVLRLYNAGRLELAAAQPSLECGGDSRLVYTLPAEGKYVVELQDLVYRGDNNVYRLWLGDFQVADSVFPLGGGRGATVPVVLSGGTLGGAGVSRGVNVGSAGLAEVMPLSLPTEAVAGPVLALPLPVPFVVSDLPEVQEASTSGGATGAQGADAVPQGVTVPAVVNGRLSQANEVDRFAVNVEPGMKLRLALYAERLGRPWDPVLEIRGEQGNVLVTQDDSVGSADPEVQYTVPEKVTKLVLAVSDAHRRGGAKFSYRLAIVPETAGDFELNLLNPLLNVPAGGTASVRVRVVRRNLNDAIRLRIEGPLPAGVQLTGDVIPAGVTDTFLSVTAPENAAITSGLLRVIGEIGPREKPTLARVAKLARQPIHDGFPWLRESFAGAVTKAGVHTIEVEQIEPIMARGVEYVAKVKVRRKAGETGPIALTVQTAHVPAAGQGNLAPVANLTIPENMNEGQIKINVPVNVAEVPMAYVVSAQLLDAKTRKTPVGVAESPVVLTRVQMPFSVQLGPVATLPKTAGVELATTTTTAAVGAGTAAAAAAPLAPVELQRGVRTVIQGKVTRFGSFNKPVVVTLTGLPAPFRFSPVTVPGDVSDFEFPLLVPPGQSAGAVANVNLTASWAQAANVNLSPAPVAFPLVVGMKEPPTTLEIFHDGSDFVAALTEGAGMATLETKEVKEGKESVLVKGGPKQRGTLPGLSAPIVENPGPGQYRYLRFAWKKVGGSGAMLQLGVNNQFGAASSKGTDYRYVAGKDSLNTKAIKVSEQIPSEWTVVVRDLFADHGAFTLTGLALTPLDGEGIVFDQITLGRTAEELK